MVRWGRKIKWKKKVNSVNGGREGDEGGSKKRDMNGGPKFGPHIKSSAELLSQLPIFFSFYFLFFSIPRKKKNQNHIMERENSKNQIFKKKKGWKFFWMD